MSIPFREKIIDALASFPAFKGKDIWFVSDINSLGILAQTRKMQTRINFEEMQALANVMNRIGAMLDAEAKEINEREK
jgi:hypothetical protein